MKTSEMPIDPRTGKPYDPETGRLVNTRCYKVHIKNPYEIMQYKEVIAAGHSPEIYEREKREGWAEFDKRHNTQTEVKIDEIDCKTFHRVRSFHKQRKRR